MWNVFDEGDAELDIGAEVQQVEPGQGPRQGADQTYAQEQKYHYQNACRTVNSLLYLTIFLF